MSCSLSTSSISSAGTQSSKPSCVAIRARQKAARIRNLRTAGAALSPGRLGQRNSQSDCGRSPRHQHHHSHPVGRPVETRLDRLSRCPHRDGTSMTQPDLGPPPGEPSLHTIGDCGEHDAEQARRCLNPLLRPVLAEGEIRYHNENNLCDRLGRCWRTAGYLLGQEVPLAPGNRIDFFANFSIYHPSYRNYRVGIEVKVGGPQREIARQLLRYTAASQLDCLLVITTDVRHSFNWLPHPPDVPLFLFRLHAQRDRRATPVWSGQLRGARWGHRLPLPDR